MSGFIGIDLGERRIGVAVSAGSIATPLEVLERSDDATDAARIAALAAERDAEQVVLGYPIRLDGSVGPAAETASRFADALRAAGVHVVLWDERLSTKSVERTLIAAGTRRNKRKAVIDKLAATVILQAYLDAARG